METRSRRMVKMGGIDGNKPLAVKNPVKNRGDEKKPVLWPSQQGNSVTPSGSPAFGARENKPKRRDLLRNSS